MSLVRLLWNLLFIITTSQNSKRFWITTRVRLITTSKQVGSWSSLWEIVMINLLIMNMKIGRFIIITCKKGLILTLMMENHLCSRILIKPNFQNHNNWDNKFNEITLLSKIELSLDGHILLTSFCSKIIMNKVDGTEFQIKLSRLLGWKTGLNWLKKCKILKISHQN